MYGPDCDTDPGGTIKISVWLLTRERSTWIGGAEILILAWVVISGPGTLLRLVVGLPVLAHLGYTALTSLPMGSVPGRPVGTKQYRRNQDLRSRVVGFLNEVRRVEEYTQRAHNAGWSKEEVAQDLRAARERIMNAAAQVAAVTGRVTAMPDEPEVEGHGPVKVLTHAPPGGMPTHAA